MIETATTRLRTEALGLLDKRSSILDIARELSKLMQEGGIAGAVVGGIAVVLHGHVRTTKDIDIFVAGSLDSLAELLIENGFSLDARKKRVRSRRYSSSSRHSRPVEGATPEDRRDRGDHDDLARRPNRDEIAER